MIGKHYELESIEDDNTFLFVSQGRQGDILKIVGFESFGHNIWNLYFGDLTKEGINDSIVSNNDDLNMVINTVAKAVYIFFENNPNGLVKIRPVDDKRGRLYNTIFRRRIHEIETNFVVYGREKFKIEPYSSSKNYQEFLIQLKEKQ